MKKGSKKAILKSVHLQQAWYTTRTGGNFPEEHPETPFSMPCSRIDENSPETRNLGIMEKLPQRYIKQWGFL